MNTPLIAGFDGPRQTETKMFKNTGAATILRGSPVVLKMNGTGDGFEVYNSSEAGANKCVAYFAGIAEEDIAVGQVGSVLTKGMCNFVRCSGAVAIDTALTVNSATNDFGAGAAVSAILAVASVGPACVIRLVTAIATGTVEGVNNVSSRVMVN
jgi:hypothetical protein